MRFRYFLLLPLAATAVLHSQEPLNRAVPFLALSAPASPGDGEMALVAARRAQELGFPALAADLYDQLLARPSGTAPSIRPDLTLAFATALLDDDRPAEAEKALEILAGPRGSAWHLREGLAEAVQRRVDAARGELAAVRLEDLAPSDRPWYFYLGGAMAGARGDLRAAGAAYQQAEREPGVTDLDRARFFLLEKQAQMRLGAVTADIAEQARRNAEQFQGTATGYDFERSYAVMLDELGRKGAAVDELQRDLLILPQAERAQADEFRLLLGLIAGAADGAGRNALRQLLASGADPVRQRVALQLLGRASQRDPERASFRAEVDRLIAAPTPHPILDDLLLFSATWALGDKDYAAAERAARSLRENFPGSPLLPLASGVLAGSAWEQLRYRTAAADAGQARQETPAGDTEIRAELGVLVAEAWFRAGDFGSAADAYAETLRERPVNVAPGELMFQRIAAEIGAGSLEAAQTELDGLAANPAFDAADRWRAEWNLARALQLAGRTDAAYARVNRLRGAAERAPATGAEAAELRARMAWLQAQLSFDARDYARTLELVAALRGPIGALPREKQEDYLSTDALLEAQANFALGREAAAFQTLERIRADFPGADAAVDSYLIEADHYARQDNSVRAQQLLQQLAEKFPASVDAPYALYQAALQAERRGQQQNLQEAVRLIEQLAQAYPNSDLSFYARLKEGDLLRLLNEYPQAQQVYEDLNHKYSQRPDIVYVLLALAECDNAQATGDPAHAESAQNWFDYLLRDRPDAPADVRVEAGFNLGLMLKDRGERQQARAVWYGEVAAHYLDDPARSAQLGGKGRYWLVRTQLELGDLDERDGRLEEAKATYRQLIQELGGKMPGVELARARLAALQAPAP